MAPRKMSKLAYLVRLIPQAEVLFNPADAVSQGGGSSPETGFCQNGYNEFGRRHTLPVWVSLHQLQQLRIDLDVELGPGRG